jgi:LysR family transcriptional regulator AphB
MLDLNDVALFTGVARAGSFAAAARRLGMPPNTVSRRVQALERSLGVRLLQRTTRRLTLTQAGRTLFEQSEDQVQALFTSAQDLKAGGQQAGGTVRVAATADFFSMFPIEWIAEFLAAHPLVRIEFLLSDARADLMGEGIDVAVRSGKSIEAHLVARQIGAGSATLVASPAYLAARGTPLRLEALAEHDGVTLPQTPGGRIGWQLDGPRGPVQVQVASRFSANTALALLKAALAGLGIALLPQGLTAPHVASGALQQVLPAYGVKGVGLYLVYLSRRQLPRAVTAFIDFTMARMRAQPRFALSRPAPQRSPRTRSEGGPVA